ncbi:hypothetical protein QYZ45_17600 [Vibrio parahaemolyticus]|nr:hypothetical protein [Vibrio parahaemolyticus]
MQMNNTTTQFNTTKEETNTMHTEVNSTKETLNPINRKLANQKQEAARRVTCSILFSGWGLAAIVIAGIAAMASSGKGKLKINNTLTEVSEMRAAVDAWAGRGRRYGGRKPF